MVGVGVISADDSSDGVAVDEGRSSVVDGKLVNDDDGLHALRLCTCRASTAAVRPRIERATARRLKGVDTIFGNLGWTGQSRYELGKE